MINFLLKKITGKYAEWRAAKVKRRLIKSGY